MWASAEETDYSSSDTWEYSSQETSYSQFLKVSCFIGITLMIPHCCHCHQVTNAGSQIQSCPWSLSTVTEMQPFTLAALTPASFKGDLHSWGDQHLTSHIKSTWKDKGTSQTWPPQSVWALTGFFKRNLDNWFGNLSCLLALLSDKSDLNSLIGAKLWTMFDSQIKHDFWTFFDPQWTNHLRQ